MEAHEFIFAGIRVCVLHIGARYHVSDGFGRGASGDTMNEALHALIDARDHTKVTTTMGAAIALLRDVDASAGRLPARVDVVAEYMAPIKDPLVQRAVAAMQDAAKLGDIALRDAVHAAAKVFGKVMLEAQSAEPREMALAA